MGCLIRMSLCFFVSMRWVLFFGGHAHAFGKSLKGVRSLRCWDLTFWCDFLLMSLSQPAYTPEILADRYPKMNIDCKGVNPAKFNIAPENLPSQKERIVPQAAFFRGHVKLRGCTFSKAYHFSYYVFVQVPECQFSDSMLWHIFFSPHREGWNH